MCGHGNRIKADGFGKDKMTGKSQRKFATRPKSLHYVTIKKTDKRGRKSLYDGGGLVDVHLTLPPFIIQKIQDEYPEKSIGLAVREFIMRNIK